MNLIWATRVRKWHGMSSDDEGDVFHFFSRSCNTWMGPHLVFGHIILFSGASGGSRFPQGGTISQLKNYIIFIVPWGHPKGVS